MTPPFENILAGTTVKRLWEMAADALVKDGGRSALVFVCSFSCRAVGGSVGQSCGVASHMPTSHHHHTTYPSSHNHTHDTNPTKTPTPNPQPGLITGVAFAHLTPADLFGAQEAYSLGGGGILPIVSVDGRPIGAGRPGPVFAALDALQAGDMATNERMLDDPPYKHYRSRWLRDLVWKRLKKALLKMDVDTLVLVGHALVAAYGLGRLRGQRIYI